MQRVKTLIKATAALAALLALLVGIPMVLATFVGWPLPGSLPDPANVWDAVAAGNIPTQVVINALAVVVWIAWLQIAASVLLETKAAVQGRVPKPVRGLASPVQLGIGKLVATTALIITVFPRAGLAAPVPSVPLTRAMPAVSVVAPSVSGFSPAPSIHTNVVVTQASVAETSSVAPPVWTVNRGDNLWDIAQRTLGSGERWSEIFELNKGVAQPDGRSLTDPGVLERDWVLRLPDHASGSNTSASIPDPAPVADPSGGSDHAPTYTVERGDSLWGIAAAHLGDGHRYVELWDLNHDVVQADGRALVDPSVIEPGWTLAMPAPPASPDPTGAASSPAAPAPLPSAAASTTAEPDPAPAPAPVSAAGGETSPTTSPSPAQPEENTTPPQTSPTTHAPITAGGSPSAVPPTATSTPQALEPSGAPAPSPPNTPGGGAIPATPPPLMTEVPAVPSAGLPDNEPPPRVPVSSPEGQADMTSSESPSTAPLSPAMLGGAGGVLAVGMWGALLRRRRRQSIRRRPGVPAPPQRADLDEVLASLRDASLSSPAASVARLLQTLTIDEARRGEGDTRPVAVFVDTDKVSVLMSDADGSPPAGWTVAPDGRRWEHSRRHRLPELDLASPLPALATIGGTTDEPVMLDFEAAGVLSITGDDDAVNEFVRSLVLELAETPFADSLSIVVDGVDVPGIEEYERVTVADDLAGALSDLSATADQYSSALAQVRLGSCFAARVADVTADGLPPTVVVTTSQDGEVADTATSLPSGMGAVLIVVGEVAAPALEIRVIDDHVEIPELGIRCVVQRLGMEAARQIGEAMAIAADDSHDEAEGAAARALSGEQFGIVRVLPSLPDEVIDLSESDLAERIPYEDPPFEVCIELLGPVSVTGARAKPTAQQEAILSYLVTHRTADSLALQEALWRDNQPRKSRLHDVLYELRRSLGPEVLPATANNTNPLGPTVVSDLELFDLRVAAAREQPQAQAVETLCGALNLVRGAPFTYGARASRYYSWVDVENFISRWEQVVCDVAHQLSQWFHSEGDASTAGWAARQGLLACPLNEVLTCDLMLSYDLAGNARAAHTVFDEHERALETLGLGEAGDEMIEILERIRAGGATNRVTRVEQTA